MSWKKKALYGAVVVAGVGGLVFALRPAPLEVDGGAVTVGAMEVTIDDQGETRSHDRFLVAAPVSGRLMRIELHVGDPVAENQVIAQLAPLPLSPREREELAARVAAAEALQREAVERVHRFEEELALARRERERVDTLAQQGAASAQQVERARTLEVTTRNELDAMRFRALSAAAEVKVARSGMMAEHPERGQSVELVQLRSPIAGRILRIEDPSERVVAVGSPLLIVGDLDKLEVVIELLSSEAVKVRPGMPVRLEGFGGDQPLRAQVRLVEPLAFTKVSALGVEEKRTSVVADFIDPKGPLGDGFRVMARIVVWRGEQVLKVPASALFRCGGDAWCAFRVDDGRAVRCMVEVGHRSALEAEVRHGLRAGDVVVRHPGTQVTDGVRIRIRAGR